MAECVKFGEEETATSSGSMLECNALSLESPYGLWTSPLPSMPVNYIGLPAQTWMPHTPMSLVYLKICCCQGTGTHAHTREPFHGKTYLL